MRLDRLDLTRFGKFTDRVVDFGAPRAGMPDLHIVYGPNEAGKSTLCAAFLDLLYGIGNQTPFAFRHAYGEMCIGARLAIEGGPLELRRIKGRSSTLLDARDAPVPETVLQASLGGIARGAYEAMFLLDDDTLEKGGEEILESKGDLGRLLFSASAGLSDLSATLDALAGEADAFHRPGARKFALADLKAELDAIDEARKALDTLAPEHTRLRAEEESALAAWQEAQSEAAAAQARLDAVERLRGALPVAQRLSRIEAELDGLPALPEPPSDWAAAHERLLAEEIAARTRHEAAQGATAKLEARLAGLVVDPDALALAPLFAEAKERKSGFDEALKDLPRRRASLDETKAEIAVLVRRLGREDRAAETLVLPDAKAALLRRLTAERSGLVARLATAAEEVESARARAEETKAALDGEGAAPADAIAALAKVLASIEAQDPVGALAAARQRLDGARDELARRRAALAPWRGDDAALAALVLPPRARIDALLAEREEIAQARRRAAAETTRCEAEIASRKADLAAARETGSVAIEEAAQARADRERAWAAHRAALDAGSADAFEAALRRDDEIATRRLAAGAAEGRLAEIHQALARLRAEHERAERAQAEADARAEALVAAIAAAIPDPAFAALPLADLRERVGALDEARAALDGVARAEKLVREAEAALGEATRSLAACLATAAIAMPNAPFAALLARARSVAEAAVRLRERRDVAARAARDLAAREEDFAKARAADADWREAWEAACAGTWLADGALPDAADMADILAHVERLRGLIEERDRLAARIEAMERNEAAFAERAHGLGAALALPEAPPAALFASVETALHEAQRVAREHGAAEAELAQARRDVETHREQLAGLAARLAEMADFFGLPDASGLGEALATVSRRRDCAKSREETARELAEILGAEDLAAARAALAGADREALDAERARLSEEVSLHRQEAQARFARLSEVRRQISAIGDDDSVARLDQDRAALLVEIEERTRAHLRLRLGVLAVGEAIRRFRDRHRSAMLERAASAFATISGGAYVSLDAQPGRDRQEVLVAIGADGGSKRVSDLSKGTRFQLYLALRVAGYHEFARHRTPVPFVADDIMETFDDDRSAQAFRLLAGMAEVGQVIYLTHHRHLCAIARETCPGVVVHDLA